VGSQVAVGRFLGIAVAVLLLFGVVGTATVSPPPNPTAQASTTVPPTTTTSASVSARAPTTPSAARPRSRAAPAAVTTTTEPPGPVLLVSGRILDDSGRGVPGAELLFGKRPSLSDGLSMLTGLFSSCSGTGAPVECRWLTAGTTGPDGNYTLRYRLTLAEARDIALLLRVTWPGVSTAQVPVTLDQEPYRVPDVTMWRPELRVTEGRATWRPYPRDDARYRFSVVGGGPFGKDELVAKDSASTTGTAFEHRLLEDLAKTATVTATVLDEVHESLPLEVRGPGAPPTRDRPCQVVPDDPNERRIDFATCPVTRAVERERLPGSPEAHHLVVDLGSSRQLSLAVVWASVDFAVDVSEDGTTWDELVAGDEAMEPMPNVQTAYARQPQQGRYVRLRLPEKSIGLFFVRRLAVW
jgi:hypothetical protein